MVRREFDITVTPCYVVVLALLKCSSMWQLYFQDAHNDVNVAGYRCMLK